MVFVNEAWNGTGEIVVYSNYHKYWLDRERKIKNPLFDVFSGKILDLKDNKVYFLRRSHSINKLATGGSRNLSVHMQSIDTVEDIDISGDIVLLMDDVTTTGNSLYVCKEILLNRGAANVEMFALGKAI
jgi:phosphoribosylpyrophosphate synthetase